MTRFEQDRLIELLETVNELLKLKQFSLIGSGVNQNLNTSHLDALESVIQKSLNRTNDDSGIIQAVSHKDTIIISRSNYVFNGEIRKGAFNVFTQTKSADGLCYDEMIGLISALTLPEERHPLRYLRSNHFNH